MSSEGLILLVLLTVCTLLGAMLMNLIKDNVYVLKLQLMFTSQIMGNVYKLNSGQCS